MQEEVGKVDLLVHDVVAETRKFQMAHIICLHAYATSSYLVACIFDSCLVKRINPIFIDVDSGTERIIDNCSSNVILSIDLKQFDFYQ
ncbi:MAG: hypothetical protein EZS28_008989 [Streblomastix strix]|uniref:Uncharacterized protein n=1 Tax=Streblomastix strix TaxID=222440 RepID=A0A5J4WKM6_9EUKA|nr:MAG: hypothetical protein EZS28_008989 [Streblomastix strix]